MENSNLKTIEELLGYTFHIETYQRGYRWDIAQVLNLLNDIDEFSKKDKFEEPFYCLQPLVVKEKETNKIYELIDGQQRSTTIHLILKYLKSKNFEITYTTRNTEDTGDNDFIKQLSSYSFPSFTISSDIDDYKSLDTIISNSWREVIEGNDAINTVDNFYLYRAFSVIKNWFELENREGFLTTLMTDTKVIWYEENKESTEQKIVKKFIDFNEGKIALEQAELIKALFVLDILKLPSAIQRNYEENKFAEDWNLIEHQLSDPKFWQFISHNKNDEGIANKINLVFQLHNGYGKNEDRYYNYRKLERAFANDTDTGDKPKWDTITNLYNSLEEWYFDRTTYHLCGAIIHLTENNISDILEKAKKSITKQEFRNELRNILKKFFYDKDNWKDKYNPDLIAYGNNSEVTKVLFLFNIALTQIVEKDTFFPFNRFYNVNSWNIEHILAKNDDGLKDWIEFSNYSKEVRALVQNAKNDTSQVALTQDNLDEILSLCDGLDDFIINKKLSQCKKMVNEINEKLAELFQINDFNNLCLLDQSTNIKVGKRPFSLKRDIILQHNDIKLNKNAYIPIGSHLVFSKQATPSENYQPNYWSFDDRKFYLKKVKDTISQFLKPE